jgi:hypothetical protein
MPRLKLAFSVLDRLLELRAPQLHAHFAETGVHVAHFSSRYVLCVCLNEWQGQSLIHSYTYHHDRWFVTLYSNLDTLPLPAVLRVWDTFVSEGCVRLID